MARRSENGTYDACAFRNIIKLIRDELHLDKSVDIKVQFKDMKRQDGRQTIYLDTHTYKIEIKRTCSFERIVHVLAHELRHVYQYHTKMMVAGKGDSRTWQGVEYTTALKATNSSSIEDIDKYNQQPWEDDANTYMYDFYARYVKMYAKRI
jgi:hypothetical protein